MFCDILLIFLILINGKKFFKFILSWLKLFVINCVCNIGWFWMIFINVYINLCNLMLWFNFI